MSAKRLPVESPSPEGLLLPVPGLNYGVLDELLGYALRRAQNALYLDFYRAVQQSTAGSEVSPQRFAALVLVGQNPGMRQGLLAQAMGLHRSGALRLTDWLTAQGWAERRDDPADARRWGLHLTAAGRRMLATLEQAVRAHDQALLVALNERGAGLKSDLERLAWVATAAVQPLPAAEKNIHRRQAR
jgi:DNA-binding MarR family transcriptional regulator